MALRLSAYFLLSLVYTSCWTPHRATVNFYIADQYRFSQAERDIVQEIGDATALEVERLLPSLPNPLIVKVQAGQDVMPETGEAGSVGLTNVVYWTVDPHRSGGVTAVANAHLRATLGHLLVHLVRAQTVESVSLMDYVIAGGIATAFERDFTGTPVAWAQYPENVSDWVKELLALPPTAPRDQWMSRHPDGRRWIGYKTGAYLVDRAARRSGKPVAQLVSLQTADIIRMALGK